MPNREEEPKATIGERAVLDPTGLHAGSGARGPKMVAEQKRNGLDQQTCERQRAGQTFPREI